MRLSHAAIATAPLTFVFLWSTGFIGAKYGLPYAEPLTFLAPTAAAAIGAMREELGPDALSNPLPTVEPPALPDPPPARTMREILRLALNDKRYGLAACGFGSTDGGAPQVDTSVYGAGEDWDNPGGDWAESHFSRLTDISKENVGQLGLAWQFKTGVSASFQTTPIVVGGAMYVSLPYNHVLALDARTGKQLWRADGLQNHPIPSAVAASSTAVKSPSLCSRIRVRSRPMPGSL